jgi:hypothetical protein
MHVELLSVATTAARHRQNTARGKRRLLLGSCVAVVGEMVRHMSGSRLTPTLGTAAQCTGSSKASPEPQPH